MCVPLCVAVWAENGDNILNKKKNHTQTKTFQAVQKSPLFFTLSLGWVPVLIFPFKKWNLKQKSFLQQNDAIAFYFKWISRL